MSYGQDEEEEEKGGAGLDDQEHYAELEAEPGASHERLKASYRRLVLELHPDTGGAGADSARLQRVRSAWEALGASGRRSRYDARRAAAAHAGATLLDTLRLAEMHRAADGRYAWPCRCGGRYELRSEDAEPSGADLLLPCDECSFHILVRTADS